MSRDIYENPLALRYASKEMNQNWSPQKKFSTWRRLWIALAKAEQELGLNISDDQIAEMEANIDNIDFAAAEQYERQLRHDVMSHVHAFGDQCPKAMPIIHLGATSCYVGDNTDLVQIRDGLEIVRDKLYCVIKNLAGQAQRLKDLPTLGYTHFQPAQLTTLGKRISLWLYDFVLDMEDLEALIIQIPFRGVKGTTGTQASFVELFDGDEEKVEQLDQKVTAALGFEHRVPVCGQTYTRKFDFKVLTVLSGIAQSAAKMSSDIRLLAHLKEVEEPFGKKQIGSSAMAYKRNPMRSERVCSLARFVMSLSENAAQTHANQWMERTLDDSANRRMSLPEGFLGVDVILTTVSNVAEGLQVWPKVIEKHIHAELPFMATENIIMACVKAGGDRQQLHEAIRVHSMEAARVVKEKGEDNDLLERIEKDPVFSAVHGKTESILNPAQFVGRAPKQVEEMLAYRVNPLLERLSSVVSGGADEVNV